LQLSPRYDRGVPGRDNANWISALAGRAVEPPRRETLQDLIDSREFWLSLADLDDLPATVEVRENVLLWDRGDTRLTAEIYVPEGDGPFPLLLHVHGGGYCTGSVLNDRKAAMRFAERGYTVINPEYGLAPERPFPRAVEDCLYTARWLASHAGEYRGDASRVVFEGGSAGAGLCAATIVALAGGAAELDQGDLAGVEVRPSAAVLFYGLLSFPLLLLEPGSNVGPAELWTRAYLGPHFTTRLRHPLASPLFAEDLSAFPPTYLSCGIEDSLLRHTLEFVNGLAQADVPATLSVVEGLDHSFVKLADSLPAASRELERVHEWLAGRMLAAQPT
jgi:acetyl esterase/lipase